MTGEEMMTLGALASWYLGWWGLREGVQSLEMDCVYNAWYSLVILCPSPYITIMKHRMGPRCTDFSCQEERFVLGSDDNPCSPIPNQEIRICNDRPQSTWTLVAGGLIAFHVQLALLTLVHLPDTTSPDDRQTQTEGGRKGSYDWLDRLGQNQLSGGLSNSDTVSAFLCNWAEPQYTVHGIIKNWKWYFAFETK